MDIVLVGGLILIILLIAIRLLFGPVIRQRPSLRHSTAESVDTFVVPSLSQRTEAVISLKGPTALVEGYQELRSRKHLRQIQAIWSADYGQVNVDEYFTSEGTWHRTTGRDVRVERLINTSYIDDDLLSLLKALGREHDNLQLYTCEEGNFEVYLCEYQPPGRVIEHAGILVVNDPQDRKAEFGVLFDGQKSADVELPLRSLQRWFASINKHPVEENDHVPVVWDFNAGEYDRFVSRESPVPILGHFIREEDKFLEQLLLSETVPITFLEYGSGTGRTIHHLSSIDKLQGTVQRFIGFDVSRAMVEESQRKRESNGVSRTDPLLYFFTLDAARADRYFWRGSIKPSKVLNDRPYLQSHPLDQEDYKSSKRVIVSLLNTTGVLDAATRATFIKNMFIAASPGDTIILSLFDKEAFRAHAPKLYGGIQPILGENVNIDDDCFDSVSGNFRAGNYFSHWSDEAEVQSLVASAQGRIVATRDITLQSGQRLGFICSCEVDEELGAT
jgi:SAM-dependent methyltransferase